LSLSRFKPEGTSARMMSRARKTTMAEIERKWKSGLLTRVGGRLHGVARRLSSQLGV
jgi:hypothetical protein